MKDPIVQSVIDKFAKRSEVGVGKYGTTLEENNNNVILNRGKYGYNSKEAKNTSEIRSIPKDTRS